VTGNTHFSDSERSSSEGRNWVAGKGTYLHQEEIPPESPKHTSHNQFMNTSTQKESNKRSIRFRYPKCRDRGMVDMAKEEQVDWFIPFSGELTLVSLDF
jgi:hypothetical protein